MDNYYIFYYKCDYKKRGKALLNTLNEMKREIYKQQEEETEIIGMTIIKLIVRTITKKKQQKFSQ